jgi:hypothetical protein
MKKMIVPVLFAVAMLGLAADPVVLKESLPPLKDGMVPQSFAEMWAGFDPQAEPLDVEVLKEWEQEGIVLKVLRYRIGVFKGRKAMMAAVYGYPKSPRTNKITFCLADLFTMRVFSRCLGSRFSLFD